MTALQGNSWLVPLADLSMILFVVTGASMASLPQDGAQQVPPPPVAQRPLADLARSGFVQSVPVAVLVDGPGNPPLAEWIAAQASDRAGQLTIEGRFRLAGERAGVARRAEALANAARAAGVEPRLVIAPGPAREVTAVFAYDRDPQMPSQLAQGLLPQDQ